MTDKETEKIGIIAGGGQFPLLFAKAVRTQGFQVYAAAHQGETDESLQELQQYRKELLARKEEIRAKLGQIIDTEQQ